MNYEPNYVKRNQFSNPKNEHKPSFNKELRNEQPGGLTQNETNFTRPLPAEGIMKKLGLQVNVYKKKTSSNLSYPMFSGGEKNSCSAFFIGHCGFPL